MNLAVLKTIMFKKILLAQFFFLYIVQAFNLEKLNIPDPDENLNTSVILQKYITVKLNYKSTFFTLYKRLSFNRKIRFIFFVCV